MKNYFKALFLFILVSSCSPEEVTIIGTLTTKVQPANTGNIARITQTNSNVVQLVAVPFENYIFKGWLEGVQGSPSNTDISYFIQLDASNKVITAVFELIDEDGDGVTDALDLCPNTPEGEETVDGNGCGESQKDDDGDGVMNNEDECPNTILGQGDTSVKVEGNSNGVDSKGCADYQKDTDGDGVMDDVDLCANTPNGEIVNATGCSGSQIGIEGVNFMNGILSGGSADVIEIAEGNNADIYEELSTSPDCNDSWFPRGSLCDQAPHVNDPDYSYRENEDSGATWEVDDFNDYGILVIDLGSEQFINSMSVFQMMDSDGKTTHIEAYAYPNATAPPSSGDSNWSQLFPYTEVGEGTLVGNTVSDPLKIEFSGIFTRYIMLYLKNDGSLGDEDYVELRQIKAFYNR